MPFRALHTGATGMMAQSTAIDVIANNVANVNTLGFKSARANFVVDNRDSFEDTYRQVKNLWEQLKNHLDKQFEKR